MPITPVDHAPAVRKQAHRIKTHIGITATIEVLPPHALERSLGKAKRINDRRNL